MHENDDAKEDVQGALMPHRPLDALPAPADLKALLLHKIEHGVAAMRAERGDVHMPEDTFALQRELAYAKDVLGEYGRAFAAAEKVALQIAEEELIEAVGEQDGIPNEPLIVPDGRGDVRVAPDFKNEYQFDLDSLIEVVAVRWGSDLARLIALDGAAPPNVDVPVTAVRTVRDALNELLSLGSFLPSVRAVDAYAKHVARQGDDNMSAVVRSAKRKTRKYKGVKITRESS